MGLDVRAIEKALLVGKWDDRLDSLADNVPEVKVARNVVNGQFHDLKAAPSRDLFTLIQPNNSTVDRPLSEWFKFSQASAASSSAEDELLRLSCAVACLHAFLQANWTGPDLDITPLELLTLTPELSPFITEDVLHQKAVSELAYGGEPAYHLAKVPIFLQLARLLLEPPFQYLRSAPWWHLRAWRVHQQVLDEPAAAPDAVLAAVAPLLEDFASEPDLAGRLLLEQGLLEHYVGNDKSAAALFVRAARATQLEYELTGALGKRTRFQERDITQLVLLAESRPRGDGTDFVPSKAEADETADPAIPTTLPLNDDTLLEQTAFTSSSAAVADAISSPSSSSRLAHIDPAAQPALYPLDQSILLALCLNVKNTSPAHGLTTEQMAPYVARVSTHPANWTVHTTALLLRARLEAHRTRTVERAVLQLQALVDQMPAASDTDAPVADRLRYIHALLLPPRWELERELAARYLTLGVVKSALGIFERLELWEDAVKCWAAMERPDRGVALVRDLLAGRRAAADAVLEGAKAGVSAQRRAGRDAAREAKLWCLLGDLEPAHAAEHYAKAWEVSGGSSARAMRALGVHHFAQGEYAEAATCLRRAVGIAPLHAKTWFVLGCACVREERWKEARDAFVRCVTLDDEDAESWNNLASVYLRMGEAGVAVAPEDAPTEDKLVEDEDTSTAPAVPSQTSCIPIEHRLLAFRALQHGLRVSYENWRMWQNYAVVALDVGEPAEAARAVGRVVEERAARDGAACVDVDVLDRLVDAVARQRAGAGEGEAGGDDGGNLERRVTDLFERTLLPRVSSARVFRARARLLRAQGRRVAALEAYVAAYRAGPAGSAGDAEMDVEKWREAVQEVGDIVDVFINFGPRRGEAVEGDADEEEGGKGGGSWKLQARSVVRTFMARTRDFEDEPEWARLEALLEEIKQADD